MRQKFTLHQILGKYVLGQPVPGCFLTKWLTGLILLLSFNIPTAGRTRCMWDLSSQTGIKPTALAMKAKSPWSLDHQGIPSDLF